MQNFIQALIDADKSTATVEAYRKSLAHFADWFYGRNGAELSPAALTVTDVKQYRQSMLADKLSPSTINLRLAAIRAYATHYQIELGPVRGLQLERPAPRWLGKLEQARLLRAVDLAIRAAAPDSPSWRLAIRDRAIITLLINAGLRIGELAVLEWADVEINKRSGAVKVRQGKGYKERDVPLNADAREALSAWQALNPEPSVFGLSDAGAWRVVHKYATKAGVEVTPHMLRHTFAKAMVDASAPLEQVAALMGHNDLGTTRRYTLPSAEDLQEAVERIAG